MNHTTDWPTEQPIDWTSERSFRQSPHEPAFYNNPYSLYRQLHERRGPVFWHDYGFWCLIEFDAVASALKDRRFARLPPASALRHSEFSKTPTGESHAAHMQQFAQVERHSLLQLEPPVHTRLRKRINQAFVARQIETMAKPIEAMVNQCIDQFIDERACDLLTTLATPVPVTVIATLLGVPLDRRDDLLRWSHDMVKVYTLTQSYNDERLANQSAGEFSDCLLALIDEKRRKPKEDLLSLMASTRDPGSILSNEEIISVAVLLLNAGHEATVHQFGNLVNALLQNDCAPRGGFNDAVHGKRTVDEGLRYDAPLHLFLRYAQCDVELGHGVTVKAGEQVAVLLGAANRDPTRFVEPERFRPERTDGAHVSLGAGIHFCIGAALAGLELQILTDTLFKRIPDLQLAQQPQYQDLFHFHGLKALQVRW